MIPRNRKSIRKRAFHFWGLFVVLLLFTLVPICSYFGTAHQKYKAYIEAKNKYDLLQKKRQQLYNMTAALFDVIQKTDVYNQDIFDEQEKKLNTIKNYIKNKIDADTVLLLDYKIINKNISYLFNLKYENARLKRVTSNISE